MNGRHALEVKSCLPGLLFAFAALLIAGISACQPHESMQETPASLTTNSPIAAHGSPGASTPTGFTTIMPSTPNPAWQTIQDAQGWYSLTIPSAWQAMDEQSYAGEDGYVETGFLPIMVGYMGSALQVCQWMANVVTQNIYAVAWVNMYTSCKLTPLEENSDYPFIGVIENPDAPPAYHFAYIKTDTDRVTSMLESFHWLTPPSLPQDETAAPVAADFWSDAHMPDGVSISEIELPPADESLQGILYSLVPTEVVPTLQTKTPVPTALPQTWDGFNQSVAVYGYEFRVTDNPNWYRLYQNGEMKIDNVYILPGLTRIPTPNGDRILFFVSSLKDPNKSPFDPDNLTVYLVDGQNISIWSTGPDNPMQPGDYSVIVNGDMLWARLGKGTQMEVINTRKDVLYTFATYFGTRIPMEGFWAWQEHWVMEISDFVIMDGVVLNQEYGYESVFEWHAINDKPFYFFQDGPNFGVSYDGQILPVHYEAIKHGLCCGYAVDNPRISQQDARFFALKDGKWVYVILTFQE